MVLHLSHTEGGFGVPFNFVTKDVAFYTTTSRFVSWIGTFSQEHQELWLSQDDLRDSSSWSLPRLCSCVTYTYVNEDIVAYGFTKPKELVMDEVILNRI